MTPRTTTPVPRPSVLKRFGPLVAVVVAIGLVAVLSSTGRSSDSGQTVAGLGSSGKGAEKDTSLPISWDEAKKAGTTAKYDWGPMCDEETGRLKIPSTYTPPCFVARPGVKGGATSRGVTADKITIVLYQAADTDLGAMLQAKLDPDAVQIDARKKTLAMLSNLMNTWGRTIEIKTLKGSGVDETSARADAVKVADELKAFASIGGPSQSPSYADELSQRGVLCLSCGLGVPDATFQENAPYMWGLLQTPEQWLINMGDYMIERMLNRNAEFAGDPKLHDQKRRFAIVHFEQDPPVFSQTTEVSSRIGAERGFKPVKTISYQLVLDKLGQYARNIISQVKASKATTVVFMGDPIMPIYLTKAATEQNYFPEWVITGTVFTDTASLGRLYDQKQWAHAFGLSSLAVRLPKEKTDPFRLYEWYYGEPTQAQKTMGTLWGDLWQFAMGVYAAGPNLTPQTFRGGLFSIPTYGGTAVAPQVSYGNKGVFPPVPGKKTPDPDYLGIDDMVEIWWNADMSGPDEQGEEGKGMMMYANDGKRYLAGKMPKTPPDAFKKAGAVSILDDVPADQKPKDYPPPSSKGG